jgi:hypothetical protein
VVPIGYHFHFTPRDVDEFTLTEFEMYAQMCDAITEENERARKKMEGQRRRR